MTNISLSNILSATGADTIAPFLASNMYSITNTNPTPTLGQPIYMGFFRGLTVIVPTVTVPESYGSDVTASRNGTYVKLRDPRQNRFFQTGRLESTAILDGFVSASPPGDGWVQIVSATGGCRLFVGGGEYITMSGTTIIKSFTAGANGIWAVYYNSSTLKYYLRNVNYSGGNYFMYAVGDGTALLDLSGTTNVNTYGAFKP